MLIIVIINKVLIWNIAHIYSKLILYYMKPKQNQMHLKNCFGH